MRRHGCVTEIGVGDATIEIEAGIIGSPADGCIEIEACWAGLTPEQAHGSTVGESRGIVGGLRVGGHMRLCRSLVFATMHKQPRGAALIRHMVPSRSPLSLFMCGHQTFTLQLRAHERRVTVPIAAASHSFACSSSG